MPSTMGFTLSHTLLMTLAMPLKTVCTTLKRTLNTLIAMSIIGEITDHAEVRMSATTGITVPMISWIQPILLPMKDSTEPTFWPMPSKMTWNTGASVEMTVPMPCTSPAMTGAAALITWPMVPTTVWITGSTVGITVCTVCIMLVMAGMTATLTCCRVALTDAPKLASCGCMAANPLLKSPMALNRSSTMPPIPAGRKLTMPSRRLLTIPAPRLLILGAAVCKPVWMASGREVMTRPTMGMALSSRNVEAVDTSSFMEPVTSPPMAMLPSRFCAAAFIAEKEPLKVSLASLAVVPVTPRLS